MKKLFFIFLCITSSARLFATAQAPDYLITNKDTIKIHSNPLEGYFKEHPIPNQLTTLTSTGNWRGYVAFFKFEGNKLVVENIYKEEYRENQKDGHDYFLTSIYKDVFGDAKNFPCDFYTGLLICPYGKMLEYVHMGYNSIYEYYKLFEITSGIKTQSRDFMADEYYKFKRDYYNYFKTTEEYTMKANEFRQMMNEDVFIMPGLEGSRSNVKPKKENKYLQQKQAAYNVEKQLDSFMFMMVDDYIKTIEIPKKQ